MDQITMTATELGTLREELGELETRGRNEIASRIKTAREWGDLKENGEYHAAKEAQAHLETRILRLREQVRAAVVVESGTSERISHGSTAHVTDLSNQEVREFRIVSPNEAKPGAGLLSVSSPVARALLGHEAGSVVDVPTPAGVRRLRVDAVD
jgi:transcription elongation factor GreA